VEGVPAARMPSRVADVEAAVFGYVEGDLGNEDDQIRVAATTLAAKVLSKGDFVSGSWPLYATVIGRHIDKLPRLRVLAVDFAFAVLERMDAAAAGRADYGRHPRNNGGYNARPGGSEYWGWGGDSWSSDYGRWYEEWYAGKLITHGGRVKAAALSAATSTCRRRSQACTSPIRLCIIPWAVE